MLPVDPDAYSVDVVLFRMRRGPEATDIKAQRKVCWLSAQLTPDVKRVNWPDFSYVSAVISLDEQHSQT
jgi:hypothetical protein